MRNRFKFVVLAVSALAFLAGCDLLAPNITLKLSRPQPHGPILRLTVTNRTRERMCWDPAGQRAHLGLETKAGFQPNTCATADIRGDGCVYLEPGQTITRDYDATGCFRPADIATGQLCYAYSYSVPSGHDGNGHLCQDTRLSGL